MGDFWILLIPITAGVIGRWKYGSNTRGAILGFSVLLGMILSTAIYAVVGQLVVMRRDFSGMWYLLLFPPALALGSVCGVLIPVLVFRRRGRKEPPDGRAA